MSAGAGGAAGPPDACGDSETAVICDGDAPESAPAGELAGSAQPGCPTSVPVPGSDCEPEGLSCQYRSECSGAVDDDNAHCRFGQWLVVFATTASCDYFGMPVCPERSILDATGCAYEGQTCAPASCPPGTAYREGHVCRNGFWRATALTCPSERDPAYGF